MAAAKIKFAFLINILEYDYKSSNKYRNFAIFAECFRIISKWTIHTILHLVRTGRWVAILVDSITHGEEGLCAVPLREAALPMPVVWLYPKDMYIRKAMQKFMELI